MLGGFRGWVVGLAVFASAVGASAALAEVGGPPTHTDWCSENAAPCGDPLVIAEGRRFYGRLEIIGMQSRDGLCIAYDSIRFGGPMYCPGATHPPPGEDIQIHALAPVQAPNLNYLELQGSTLPEATRVRLRYRKNGKRKSAEGIVAHVAGELQQRLGEPSPFTVYDVAARGCMSHTRLRLTAFDAAGSIVGRTSIDTGSALDGGRCS